MNNKIVLSILSQMETNSLSSSDFSLGHQVTWKVLSLNGTRVTWEQPWYSGGSLTSSCSFFSLSPFVIGMQVDIDRGFSEKLHKAPPNITEFIRTLNLNPYQQGFPVGPHRL